MLNIQPDTFKGTLNSDAPGANEAFADVQDSLDDHETRVAAAESKLATVTAGAAVASVSGTGALSFTAGANPAGSIAAASASVPGTMSAADFAKLVGQLSVSGSLPVIVETYQTTVDWLAAGPFLLVPARAGFYFVPFQIKSFTKIQTGTATGNQQISIGNNASQDNFSGISGGIQTITAAGLNAVLGLVPGVGASFSLNTMTTPPTAGSVSGAAVYLKNVLIPTGLTAYSGTVQSTGLWVPQ